MRKGNIRGLGDFNFPKFSWDSEHVPTLKPGCSYTTIYNNFISCLDDHGLVQMVSEPTRGDNKSNRKAMNRNWSNQKANPVLKTKTGNK